MESNTNEKKGRNEQGQDQRPEDLHDYTDACTSMGTEYREWQNDKDSGRPARRGQEEEMVGNGEEAGTSSAKGLCALEGHVSEGGHLVTMNRVLH